MIPISTAATRLRPRQISPDEFRAIIRDRGWRMVDVACRWEISAEHLSRLAANPARAARWNDLVEALPRLASRREQVAIRRARAAVLEHEKRMRTINGKSAARPRRTKPAAPMTAPTPISVAEELEERFGPPKTDANGLRYSQFLRPGAEVVATDDAPLLDLAEGEYAYVSETRMTADDNGMALEEYLIQAPTRQAWLTPDDIDRYLADTGRSIDGE